MTDTLQTLPDVCNRIHGISTLPHIAMKVIEVANDPNSGARDMKAVLEIDAALSTRVLRCVNSSAYALRTKVTNLQQAAAFLGISQIRNLALTASVSQLFRQAEKIGPYDRKGLWKHLVAVGICARVIAMRLRLPYFEDVFLAGLLHDIGIVLEDEHVHKPFVKIMQSLQKGEELRKTEQRFLAFDHTRLGDSLARTWKLPIGVIDTMRCHHRSAACEGENKATVQCVEVANFICSAKGMASVGLNLVEFPRSALEALSLGKEDIMVLASDLDRELEANRSLFEM
jgi:HD-like signal output (HDOD) protein